VLEKSLVEIISTGIRKETCTVDERNFEVMRPIGIVSANGLEFD
jgi:hypothetical protein